jgi:hypothetical protein
MGKVDDVNKRQKRFCKLYATDKEYFGNGVETYLEVYEIDRSKPNWYKTACSAASRLLSNVKVCARINELLEEGGLNNEFVDKQLLFLVTQHADFTNKLGAIKEYNKLKQRITDKTDITSGGKPIPILSNTTSYVVRPDNGDKETPSTQ